VTLGSNPSPKWLEDVGTALAVFPDVTSARIIPNGDRFELVITTRESPPAAELIEALWQALGCLLARADSPILEELGDGVTSTTWHFDPPLEQQTNELFEALDWDRALTVYGVRQ